jgi:hypothetical protein
MAKGFKFELKQPVRLVESSETGTVIGRAEYAEAANSYLVRYKAGDHRQTEAWWSEAAVEAA